MQLLDLKVKRGEERLERSRLQGEGLTSPRACPVPIAGCGAVDRYRVCTERWAHMKQPSSR